MKDDLLCGRERRRHAPTAAAVQAPSAPGRSGHESRAACPSHRQQSRSGCPQEARSCAETLKHGTNHRRIEIAFQTDQRTSRQLDMNRASPSRMALQWHRRRALIGDRNLKQLQLARRSAAQSATSIQPPPLKHLVRVDPVSAGHASHRRTRLQRLFHNPPPLLGTAPTPTRPSQTTHTLNVNHQHIIIAHKQDVHAANTGRLRCGCRPGYCRNDPGRCCRPWRRC